ncbi:hypothetical protein CVT26_002546 [Gymnopilus dilepis]|uniref:Uncharacterized protein n=1 Tax=Gymnopilus dilepis TaxID=231916 RepID=A0A409X648_9AGAR|nr:hypothetical protein CVT26_002546 [Gymnopilus dilepis]
MGLSKGGRKAGVYARTTVKRSLFLCRRCLPLDVWTQDFAMTGPPTIYEPDVLSPLTVFARSPLENSASRALDALPSSDHALSASVGLWSSSALSAFPHL